MSGSQCAEIKGAVAFLYASFTFRKKNMYDIVFLLCTYVLIFLYAVVSIAYFYPVFKQVGTTSGVTPSLLKIKMAVLTKETGFCAVSMFKILYM